MQQGHRGSERSSSTPASRRALREAQRPRRRRSRLTATWLPRTALLTALAGATIAVPVAHALTGPTGTPVDVVAVEVPVSYPSTVEVLSAPAQHLPPTSLLAAVPGAERVSDTASRSFVRDPLPGCDGEARPAGQNGLIPASDLCTLWDGDQMLRGDAAVALSELNRGFRAAFGRDMCLTDSYRSLADQRSVAYAKPRLAATPGTSNHGWGLAIDLCSSENANQAVMAWLADNGPTFGWDNPDWARRGGSGAYEPWHWEYVPGTSELGTNY